MEARRPTDLNWSEQASEHASGRETSFVLTPSRLGGIPILVFASLWDSFFVMLWTGLSRAHAPQRAFLFPIAHAAVGVVVTWLALVRCLNVSRITINAGELAVSHSPIPTRGARLATAKLERFEADATKRGRVHAITSDGGAVNLGLTLDGQDEVAFVAARLNAALATARA